MLYGSISEGTEWLLHLINFLLSFGVVTALFAIIYKILPNLKIEWDDVWIGAIATVLLQKSLRLLHIVLPFAQIESGF